MANPDAIQPPFPPNRQTPLGSHLALVTDSKRHLNHPKWRMANGEWRMVNGECQDQLPWFPTTWASSAQAIRKRPYRPAMSCVSYLYSYSFSHSYSHSYSHFPLPTAYCPLTPDQP
jgi:hypothetical protein